MSVSLHELIGELYYSGGEEVLLDVGGQDSTEAFEDVGHSDEAREILNGMLVGSLKRQVCATCARRIMYLTIEWLLMICRRVTQSQKQRQRPSHRPTRARIPLVAVCQLLPSQWCCWVCYWLTPRTTSQRKAGNRRDDTARLCMDKRRGG